MKKLLGLFAVMALIVGMTISASAAPVVITFDEPGINVDDTITNQYASKKVNWIERPFQIPDVPLANTVTTGPGFSNPFDSDGNIVHYDGDVNQGTAVEGVIALDFFASDFSFDYRRPSTGGEIRVKLFNNYVEVHDSGTFTWSSGDGWKTFNYPGTDGPFDLIWMYSPTNKKFVIDNLEINPVPVPASVWLLASGLIPMIYRRIKK